MAYAARKRGEDPFGALLVYNNSILHKSTDKTIELSDPTAHAELTLISEFCRKNRNISLKGFTLYTSTEPCAMCAGAIHWAKISKVVFSVSQNTLNRITNGKPKASCNSVINSGKTKIQIVGPLIEEEGIKVFENYVFRSKSERIRYWRDF